MIIVPTTPPTRRFTFRLSTFLLAVTALAIWLAVANWSNFAGMLFIALGVPIVTNIVCHRGFGGNEPLAEVCGILASVVSVAAFCGITGFMDMSKPPPPGVMWMWGGGLGAALFEAAAGAVFGSMTGCFTTLLIRGWRLWMKRIASRRAPDSVNVTSP